jgi:DNA-binding response OmpR family regulator
MAIEKTTRKPADRRLAGHRVIAADEGIRLIGEPTMNGILGEQGYWFKPKVVITCDNGETGALWAYALRQKNVEVTQVSTLEETMKSIPEEVPDLVLIDVSGERLDGLELVRRLRAEAVAPIVLFSARSDEAYLLEVYLAGADEVVAKPVSPALFLAKLGAWLRRAWTVSAVSLEAIQTGDLRLDPARRTVITPQGEVKLTNLEFRVLYLLMSHAGWVLPGDEIVHKVWGYAMGSDNVALKNVIYRLRLKLETNPDLPKLIETVPGKGYRFLGGGAEE